MVDVSQMSDQQLTLALQSYGFGIRGAGIEQARFAQPTAPQNPEDPKIAERGPYGMPGYDKNDYFKEPTLYGQSGLEMNRRRDNPLNQAINGAYKGVTGNNLMDIYNQVPQEQK